MAADLKSCRSRRYLRFGLRGLILIVLVLGSGLGWWVRSVRIQHLNDTQVSDHGLLHLNGLSNLRELHVVRTKVTDAGVDDLRTAAPNILTRH